MDVERRSDHDLPPAVTRTTLVRKGLDWCIGAGFEIVLPCSRLEGRTRDHDTLAQMVIDAGFADVMLHLIHSLARTDQRTTLARRSKRHPLANAKHATESPACCGSHPGGAVARHCSRDAGAPSAAPRPPALLLEDGNRVWNVI